MARKQLIKGANAARVEARISRAPADLGAAPSIFGALKAMELAASVAARPIAPRPPAASPAGSKAKAPAGQKAKTPARQKAKAPVRQEPVRQETKAHARQPAPAKRKRLGPSDFSAAEREAILRCCTDYRNRLPTYLLAVQKEVTVIDAIIEKCRASLPGGDDAPPGEP
jgi:hypothetical protein